ncbi:hypothetical protein HLB44_34995 [Aquincola sp. S2]|uniref:Flp pilus-assembly TadG-like N-terminal domain-containing protein n=1 Tax=Pseudaquabacterium terrae TaxID=2732868 RepID=A0ABX2EUV4_9BURK|nr:hypothetical protein [Aquabacterium terrae]NRF72204.1 hypothetical protein [Aquabacterium terrae]
MKVSNLKVGIHQWIDLGLLMLLLAAILAFSVLCMNGAQQYVDNTLDDGDRGIALAADVKCARKAVRLVDAVGVSKLQSLPHAAA